MADENGGPAAEAWRDLEVDVIGEVLTRERCLCGRTYNCTPLLVFSQHVCIRATRRRDAEGLRWNYRAVVLAVR